MSSQNQPSSYQPREPRLQLPKRVLSTRSSQLSLPWTCLTTSRPRSAHGTPKRTRNWLNLCKSTDHSSGTPLLNNWSTELASSAERDGTTNWTHLLRDRGGPTLRSGSSSSSREDHATSGLSSSTASTEDLITPSRTTGTLHSTTELSNSLMPCKIISAN